MHSRQILKKGAIKNIYAPIQSCLLYMQLTFLFFFLKKKKNII